MQLRSLEQGMEQLAATQERLARENEEKCRMAVGQYRCPLPISNIIAVHRENKVSMVWNSSYMIGITYICEFSSDICRDAGYQTVAGQIEVLGKLTVMFAGLPILFAVIEQIIFHSVKLSHKI